MTEKEKRAAGMPYDPNHDAELLDEMSRAGELCWRYNSLSPQDEAARKELLRTLLGRVGDDFTIRSPFFCDYGYNITIGRNFFANVNWVVLDAAPVTIGDNVFIAPNVGIYTAGHPLDAEERGRGTEYARAVTIGNDVWIGAGVSVLPGVTIGDRVVIGAGSVVNRDIPADSLAVGNPCRVVRSLKKNPASDTDFEPKSRKI